MSVKAGQQASPIVSIEGTGDFDATWTAFSNDTSKAKIDENGIITGVAEGSATITYRSNGDSTKTATCAVTVTAAGA